MVEIQDSKLPKKYLLQKLKNPLEFHFQTRELLSVMHLFLGFKPMPANHFTDKCPTLGDSGDDLSNLLKMYSQTFPVDPIWGN